MSFIIGAIIGALIVFAIYRFKEREARAAENAETIGGDWYTVVGVWPESKERYTLHVQADDARAAEDLTQWEATHAGGTLWVTGVFEGRLDNADGYARFVDPDTKATDWLNTENGKIV